MATPGKGAPDAARLAAEWDARVRGNREQVERRRLVADAGDFYAPVSARFVQDPRRKDDAVLDALLELARPGETWLDIGAGAGRYALPLALHVARVVAMDPSPAMLDQLREGMARHGIPNIEALPGRWPADAGLVAGRGVDVSLIAHVGYDVEPIAPFLDAMEHAARRRCVAVMMDRSPAGYASPFWPPVHGEERMELPAAEEAVAMLRARGSRPRLRRLPRPRPRWTDEEELLAMLRHQLWIPERGPADERLRQAVAASLERHQDGIGLASVEGWIDVIDWRPRG
ncbi:MAG TPA: class I SAM-dependent methyltransferase [Candidatus Limnocylindrales bacterium]|nr:class I SAM-dependent methyltransferase [Candidatus Limnocylindrales bacterium]